MRACPHCNGGRGWFGLDGRARVLCSACDSSGVDGYVAPTRTDGSGRPVSVRISGINPFGDQVVEVAEDTNREPVSGSFSITLVPDAPALPGTLENPL